MRFRIALLGASAAALVLVSTTALAGSGVGDVFNLGQTNSVNATSTLTGATAAPQLAVGNTSTNLGATALSLSVALGRPPFKVNSNVKVTGLNADLLDGKDSSALPYWKLGGNAGTSSVNFIGTSDAKPLVFKTNNKEAMRIDASQELTVHGPAEVLRGGFCLTSSVFWALAGCAGSYPTGLFGDGSSSGVEGTLKASSCPVIAAGVAGCSGLVGQTPLISPSNLYDDGVVGGSDSGTGVSGLSNSGRAVEGRTSNGIGVVGSSSARGVVGIVNGVSCAGVYAVGGCAGSTDYADGVYGVSGANGAGVRAANTNGGNIFVGEAPIGAPKARIDATGKVFADGGYQTGGADYAESIHAGTHGLMPGDVLAIDPSHGYSVTKSSRPYSRLVAGVYSTKPAVLAVGDHGVNSSLRGEVPVAMMGVVPTKVTAASGAIQAGDLLTTSSSPGRAMKAKPLVVRGISVYPTGAILGKALEPLKRGTGLIRVLVMLR